MNRWIFKIEFILGVLASGPNLEASKAPALAASESVSASVLSFADLLAQLPKSLEEKESFLDRVMAILSLQTQNDFLNAFLREVAQTDLAAPDAEEKLKKL